MIGDRKRLHILTAAGAIGGAALLVVSIRLVGAGPVGEGIARLGVGFLVVGALGGLRSVLRTVAWRLCLEDSTVLPFGRTFAAYLVGGALGNITPFGMLISEPSKILLVRSRVAAMASIPALAVENLLYTMTVAVMLTAGTAGLLLAVPLPAAAARASFVLLGFVGIGTASAVWIVATERRLGTAIARRLGVRTDRIGTIEDRVFSFVRRHPDRVLPVLCCEVCFHALAVFEIWFALSLITGHSPSLLTAFVFEYVNRAITIAFQFVPLWLGVDEAGTGFVAAALGLNPAAGVTLALARKGRITLWTAVGLVLWWPTTRAWSIGRSPAPAAPARRPPVPPPVATVFQGPHLSKRSTAE